MTRATDITLQDAMAAPRPNVQPFWYDYDRPIRWTREDEVIRAAMSVENQAAMIRDEFAAGCARVDAFRLKIQERQRE